MRNVLREWQAEPTTTFTGTRDAVPEWATLPAAGNDARYHLPGSDVWAVWAVHVTCRQSWRSSAPC